MSLVVGNDCVDDVGFGTPFAASKIESTPTKTPIYVQFQFAASYANVISLIFPLKLLTGRKEKKKKLGVINITSPFGYDASRTTRAARGNDERTGRDDRTK